MTRSTSMTRRQILRRGAVAVAAAAAWPAVATHGVRAAGPAPNDQIGIGYIGCGRRSANLRGRGLPPQGRVVAAADCNLPRAKAVAAKYGAKAYQDYRELLERKDVDAVIIASPDHWHTLHGVHACQAEKDAYIEKPLTLTIHEGRVLVRAARRYGRVIQCGSQQRSMEANRRGCELVLGGAIGKLKEVIGFNYPSPWECAFPGQPVPEGLDWDRWCGQAPLVPFHKDLYAPRTKPGWISFRPYSGGEMAGWGAHGLDQIQWALGMSHSGPVEIWTEGGKFDPPTYTKPESRQRGEAICSKPHVFFRYASGVVVRLAGGPHGGAIFVGEKGTISIDRGRFTCTPKELASTRLGKDAPRLYVSNNHMQNWFDCMKSRKPTAADVETGHRSATVCHLGNIARWAGRRLRWDPEREIFPDDGDANRFLDRPRRKAYELPDIS